MSKFAIYKSKGHSFDTIAAINIVIVIILSASWLLLTTITSTIESEKTRSLVSSGLLFIWLGAVLFLILYNRYLKRAFQLLGEITITRQTIVKSIGGIVSNFDYSEIAEVRVKRVFNSFFLPGNKDSSKYYLVAITKKDLSTERFVITSQSIDKPSVNFFETLKKLEVITNHKLNISKEKIIKFDGNK